MSKFTFMFKSCCSLAVLILILQSCGLNYVPQEIPENKELERQRVIESSIKTDFEPKKMTYEGIAFGETTIMKPRSYQRLDSLFEVRYRLEQNGKTDRKLEEEIGIQRIICQTDTSQIVYLVEHVFGLISKDSCQIMNGNFALNGKSELIDVEFAESFFIDTELLPYYKAYVLNESFIYLGSEVYQQESEFYTAYKSYTATLSGNERSKFIEQTLRVMLYANKNKSLETKGLIKTATRYIVNGNSPDFKDEKFIKIDQLVDDKGNTKNYIVEYQVDITNINAKFETHFYTILFDPFLQVVEKEGGIIN